MTTTVDALLKSTIKGSATSGFFSGLLVLKDKFCHQNCQDIVAQTGGTILTLVFKWCLTLLWLVWRQSDNLISSSGAVV